MPLSRIVENRIREAMAQGEFENLAGAGRPLDLEEYFSAPEDLRMAYSILKSAHCVPPEVELLNEVARLERALAETTDASTRETLQRVLIERQTHRAVVFERMARHRR